MVAILRGASRSDLERPESRKGELVRCLMVVLAALLVGGATPTEGSAATAAASARRPSATVTGPVHGGQGHPTLATTIFDLGQVGYLGEEYFVSGTATAYRPVGTLRADGKWNVVPAATADYKTRIVVYRPTDAKKFNGTVVVEWLNDSAGFDSAPEWGFAHNELIRGGYAYVGVSAQKGGVESGASLVGDLSRYGQPLKAADLPRYSSLVHPGDSFSYDIFSQVGATLRHPSGVQPLGGLEPKRLIAVGESQSAFRMVTYVDAIHPVARVYDGFLIHSRFATGTPLSETPQRQVRVPGPTLIRTDLNVPVITLETETDLIRFGYLRARQPDSKWFRLWEVAGTSHSDAYTITGLGDTGDGRAVVALLTHPSYGIGCSQPINSGPQFAVASAAIAQLNRWARRGVPAPHAPRLKTLRNAIARDAHGNARGGIRTPLVDVPVSTLSSSQQTRNVLCSLFGTTKPFDAATLASLYPTHDVYVAKFTKATDRAVKAGFVLTGTAEQLKAAARQSSVGR